MANLIIYIPEFDSDTALFFFYRGGSWKLRDFSTGREKVVSGNQVSKYTVDEIRSMALHEEKVRPISVKNVDEWKSEIERVNKLLIKRGIITKFPGKNCLGYNANVKTGKYNTLDTTINDRPRKGS